MKALTVGVTTIVMASLAAWTMAADEIGAVLQNSFVAKNQATMDRLERDAVQTACSAPRGMPLDNNMLASLRMGGWAGGSAAGQMANTWATGSEVRRGRG